MKDLSLQGKLEGLQFLWEYIAMLSGKANWREDSYPEGNSVLPSLDLQQTGQGLPTVRMEINMLYSKSTEPDLNLYSMCTDFSVTHI